MSDVWYLHEIDWLSELPADERQKLRDASIVEQFPAGQLIFAPSQAPHSVYLLEAGCARIYRLSEAGGEATFGYVAPGEVFGELPGFGDYPRESFAEAVEPSTVWRIPTSVFQALLQGSPTVAVAITKQIGARFKSIETRVENLVFRDVRARLAGMLLELAERFGQRQDGSEVIDLELTQAELATLVGATRQSVNESLGELRSAGWVRREGRKLVLLDLEALRGMARGPREV